MPYKDFNELAFHDGGTLNMVALQNAYHSDIYENEGYYERAEDAYKVRRNLWAGKDKTLKKTHPSAKPWQYASDNESWISDTRIDSLVALAWNAWERGDVLASPQSGDDMERATSITNFMRYTMNDWIPNPRREFELCANYMLEKSIAATYVGYEKYNTPILERIDAEFIMGVAEIDPDLAEVWLDEDREEEALALLQDNFEYVNEKRAKKALRQLRREGAADIPVSIIGVDRPIVSSKAMDSEVFLPPDTIDGEKARRAHVLSLMSISEITAIGRKEGWDEDVMQDIIDNHMGITQQDIDGQNSTDGYSARGVATTIHSSNPDTMELTPVVRTFMKQVDDEDGAMGIYEVVWSPRQSQSEEEPNILSYELMNGLDCIPIVFTPFKHDSKRIYESRSLVDSLRGVQRNSKVLSDSMIDNISINMDKPRFRPPNGEPMRWGPSRETAIRRGTAGDYGTFETTDMSRAGAEMEEYFDSVADKISGLDMEDPISVQRQQMFVSRILGHWSRVAQMVWRIYKEYGPEEKAFRVTGDPSIAPSTFEKGAANEGIDVRIDYDVALNDSSHREKVSNSLIATIQADTEGVGNRREALKELYRLNLPVRASRIIQTAEESQEEVTKRVSDDIAKLQAKIPVNAVTAGASIALNFLQAYESQPDVADQLQRDIGFAQRYAAYREQYTRELEQQENAQIGRNINPNAMIQSNA